MTLGTGKRSYRACLRCRRRKTKCDLDSVGEPKKAPCVSCYQSGSDCVLVASRRGRTIRSGRPTSRAANIPNASIGVRNDSHRTLAGSSILELEESTQSDHSSTDIDNDEYRKQMEDENLCMELRNPSDALQILAHSADPSNLSLAHEKSSPEAHSDHNELSDIFTSGPSPSVHSMLAISHDSDPGRRRPSKLVLDNYELVQRGLLHPSVVPELLSIFGRSYHAYCPIVPSYFFGPSAMEKIQKSDYFLLTVILTIASRDSPNHTLTHRYCWDYTQRHLLEILLAQPWAHTSRTVEGLLLLAEWLPHVQINQTAFESPKHLFSEDRTAWSFIGLAVRQGYLLRLDRAAFRNGFDHECKELEERKRLIWTFIYLADRQISVRLGQSFWSRGPSLSSKFTAKDFPSLKSISGIGNEDHASVLEATLELTQILYNAHGILYSSTERTLAMIYDGDYPSYLDDFQRSVTTWHLKWENVQASHNIKSTLFLMYEYIRLYVNAFSFQAVLTRTSTPQLPLQRGQQTRRESLTDLFSRGIMSSPDGQYVFDAINAAKNLLGLVNGLDSRHVLCYLPSRYHLYGVYAAVFLHKAQSAGAFQSTTQRREVTSLVLRFITAIEEAPSIESHICRRYSRMLRKLWHQHSTRRGAHDISQNLNNRPDLTNQNSHEQGRPSSISDPVQPSQQFLTRQEGHQHSPSMARDIFGGINIEAHPDTLRHEDNVPDVSSIEEYLFGSFWPGITEFSDWGEHHSMADGFYNMGG